MSEHKAEPEQILEKYVFLQADKCRGNYILVCKKPYIKQCVQALHTAPEYQKQNITPSELFDSMLREISGLINHSHFEMITKEDLTDMPYFYTLPKPHKNLLLLETSGCNA